MTSVLSQTFLECVSCKWDWAVPTRNTSFTRDLYSQMGFAENMNTENVCEMFVSRERRVFCAKQNACRLISISSRESIAFTYLLELYVL